MYYFSYKCFKPDIRSIRCHPTRLHSSFAPRVQLRAAVIDLTGGREVVQTQTRRASAPQRLEARRGVETAPCVSRPNLDGGALERVPAERFILQLGSFSQKGIFGCNQHLD